MGIKYSREYAEIIDELTTALMDIPDIYEFFGMEKKEWEKASEEEKQEYVKTLSDDVFYGLGTEGSMEICDAIAEYDGADHVIRITYGDGGVINIKLI